MLRKFLHLTLLCGLISAVQSSDIVAQDNAEYRYTGGLIQGNIAWIEASLISSIPTFTGQGRAVNQTERFEQIEGGQKKYIDLFYPFNPMNPIGVTHTVIQIGATAKGAYYIIDTYSLRNGADKPEFSESNMKFSRGSIIPGQIRQSVATSSSASSKSSTVKFGF